MPSAGWTPRVATSTLMVRPTARPELDGAADGTTDAGMADAAQTADGAAGEGGRDADASPDGSTTADAGADTGWPWPPCPAPTPTCESINRSAADILASFTQPCEPEGFRLCGGLVSSATLEAGQHVVETLPLVCRSGRWELAGVWAKSYWSPYFECSRGCPASMLCPP